MRNESYNLDGGACWLRKLQWSEHLQNATSNLCGPRRSHCSWAERRSFFPDHSETITRQQTNWNVPWFLCVSMGEMILSFSNLMPERKIKRVREWLNTLVTTQHRQKMYTQKFIQSHRSTELVGESGRQRLEFKQQTEQRAKVWLRWGSGHLHALLLANQKISEVSSKQRGHASPVIKLNRETQIWSS